jgi:hypothetical protein
LFLGFKCSATLLQLRQHLIDWLRYFGQYTKLAPGGRGHPDEHQTRHDRNAIHAPVTAETVLS